MNEYAEFDFHLHTLWSYDATTPVEEYFRLAQENHVKTIAITDHHTIDAWEEVKAAGKKYPDVSYIAGAELTVTTPYGAMDLVCLNMPDKPAGDLAEVLNSYHIWQRESGSAYSRYLTQGGFTFTDKDRYELIARYREPRCMALQGTTHVQAGMLIDYMVNEKHYFRDRAEFWEFIRKHDMPLYPDHAEVVPAVKKAGGLVFLAHPVNYFLKNDLNRMDELRELLQLDGIECAHSEVPGELTPFYREYCEKHKLLSSAGSDCHSLPGQPYCFSPDCKFGRVPADPKWREEIAERVKIFNA